MVVQEKTSLVSTLREVDQNIWQAMVKHPFLVEVEEDRLPEDKLRFYFVQNVNYIQASITASAQAAAMAPTDESRALCLDLTRFGSEEIERQRRYVSQLSGGRAVDWAIAANCHAYTSHLLKVASYGGTLDYLVALMPCSWSYDEFATELAPKVSHPVTKEWLSHFGGDEHNDITERYHASVNQLGETLTADRSAELHDLFKVGCRYEYMFWDMSYNMSMWPI